MDHRDHGHTQRRHVLEAAVEAADEAAAYVRRARACEGCGRGRAIKALHNTALTTTNKTKNYTTNQREQHTTFEPHAASNAYEP